MQNGAQRLQLLIRDILTYSRLTDNNVSFVKSNLNHIIDEILLDLELRIKESNANIIVSELPELDVNPAQISQLFQNIISNGLKFARRNISPEIHITSEIGCADGKLLPKGKKYCHISIRDNGIGFDETFLEQIFTLFKRLNDSSEYEGTGIGLAICKKIVEKHKGYIHAKSRLNEGSTFIISLPLSQSQNDAHKAKKHLESVNSR
jgi:signal transduction histidine kinase